MRTKSVIIADIRYCVVFGLLMSAVFSAFVLLVALVTGTPHIGSGHWAVWWIVIGYLMAGLLGGTVVGLLQPLTKHKFGGALVGSIAGVLGYGSIAIALGLAQATPLAWILPGIVIGGALGYNKSG